MDTESQASRPSTTDLLIRRFIYYMWRMDEAAREFGSVKDGDDHEKMRKRWEIGLTYELESFLRVLSEMTFIGLMSTSISEAIARRFTWFDISSYPPRVIWARMPSSSQYNAPDLGTIFGHLPILKEGEALWWCYPKGLNEVKPAWWDDPEPEKWLHEVRIPRHLLGSYLRALTDSEALLGNGRELLEAMLNNKDLPDKPSAKRDVDKGKQREDLC